MAEGHPLQRYREAHGMSRRELAERIGTSDVQVWRIEAGTRQPSLSLMRRISAATEGEVTPNDFLAQPEPSPGPVPESDRLAS